MFVRHLHRLNAAKDTLVAHGCAKRTKGHRLPIESGRFFRDRAAPFGRAPPPNTVRSDAIFVNFRVPEAIGASKRQ